MKTATDPEFILLCQHDKRMCSRCRKTWCAWKVASKAGRVNHCRYPCDTCLPLLIGIKEAAAAIAGREKA